MVDALARRKSNRSAVAAPETMRAAARLRSRIVAVLNASLERSQQTQSEIALRLGVRRSAVHQVLNGSGNIQIDTLSEYLAVMGFEADLIVARVGEFSRARAERRAPETVALTMADRDRMVAPGHHLVHTRAIAGANAALSTTDAQISQGSATGEKAQWR